MTGKKAAAKSTGVCTVCGKPATGHAFVSDHKVAAFCAKHMPKPSPKSMG